MRFTCTLFLICFLTIGVFAQEATNLTGIVTDAKGSVKATVTLTLQENEKIKYTQKSAPNGRYYFTGVQPGNYLLSASSSDGYRTGISQVIKFRLLSEMTITKNLVIENYTQIREEVLVKIAAGTTQPISNVSKTVNIIGDQEIRDRNEITLGNVLSTIPGFRFQQLGSFGRLASIKTRGLRNQDTAVLVDGFRFRDSATISGDASSFLSNLTLPNIGRIEVLRGSGSSIYGTNAIGGVIDFQTPEPTSDLKGDLTGQYGGLGMTSFRGSIGAGTKDGKVGFNLGIARTAFTEGIDGEDDADNSSIRGRIDFNPFNKTNISGRIYASDSFVRLNLSPDTMGTLPAITQIIDANRGVNFVSDANDPDNLQRSDFFSGQIALTQIINSQLVFKAGYQGLKTSRENENGGLGPGFQPFGGTRTTLSDGQIHTFYAKAHWTPVSNNLVTFGYEYELEKYESIGIGPTVAGDSSTRVDQSSNTFFVQDLLGLFDDKLQLAGGFRVQWFSLDQPTFSVNNAPYAGLTLTSPETAYTFDGSASYYFASTGTKIRAHVGNGYRVPSLFQRFGTFFSSFTQTFTALGDPNLGSESSIAFDGGIDQSLAGDRVKLSTTYFYTRLLDTIGFANVAPNVGTTARPFGGYFNNRGGMARGAEFSGDFKLSSDTDVFTSYTFTNSDQRESQVAGSGILQTLGIADHQFTLVVTQRFGKRVTVNFDFLANSSYLVPIFSSSIVATRIYRFNGIRKGDLTGRYEMPAFDEKVHVVFFGTLENIFDNEYFENGFRTPGRTGRIGVGLRF